MTERRGLLLPGAIGLLVLALAVAGVHALWGEGWVQAAYEERLPYETFNRLIKRRAEHPVEYYQQRAATAVHRLVWGSGALVLLAWGATRARRRWPDAALLWPPFSAALGAGAAFCLVCVLQIPVLQLLPHWFWAQKLTGLPWWWLGLGVSGGLLWVAGRVLDRPERTGLNLALVVALGFCVQQGMAWMEGDGQASLTARLLDSAGHGLLAQAAVAVAPGQVVGDYEQMLQDGRLTAFPHATRPPGPLWLLGGLARLAGGTKEGLAAVGVWLFPLCTYLAVVPLFFLARLYVPTREAWLAGLLYAVVPATALMAMHLDQWLLPLLGWTAVALWAVALKKDGWAWGLAAGCACYAALFFSFSLVALAPLMACLAWRRLPQCRRPALLAAAGFALCYGLFYWGLDYDAWTRYRQAMQAHQAFKVADWGLGETLYFAGLNLLEFAVWCGLPLAMLAGYGVAAVKIDRPQLVEGGAVLALGLVAVLAGLALFGRTAGETGRLWIFLMPLVGLVAAGRVEGRREAVVLLAGQWVTVWVMKGFQDF